MTSNENPCVVLGPVGFHRLAYLLFDHTIHILLSGDRFGDQPEELSELSEAVRSDWPSHIQVDISELTPKCYTISSSTGQVDYFGPQGRSESEFLHPFVAITSVPTIDPDSLSNDLVLEMRQDGDARAKLKRFKAFAHRNYRDQPLSYIHDDLESRLLDYRLAAKKWGLNTLGSTFTVSAADKILSGACAGLVSAIFGLPLAEAASVGVVAAIADATITVGLSRKSFAISQSQDAISYIANIQDSAAD